MSYRSSDHTNPFRITPLMLALLTTSVGGLTLTDVTAAPLSDAYFLGQLKAPLQYLDPIEITLVPDTNRCPQPKAGANPCDRALASAQQPAYGIQMSPSIAGRWQWTSERTLAFFPESPWTPATDITVNLSQLRLPQGTKLSTSALRLNTGRLAAHVEPNFLASTRPEAVGSLALRLTFSGSVGNRTTIEKAITLTNPDPQHLTLGTPRYLWEQHVGKDIALVVQYPVLTLPKGPTHLLWEVKGIEDLAARQADAGKGQTVSVALDIPGTQALYQIRNASLMHTTEDDLSLAYDLTVNPTLLTPPEALLKAIKIWELPEKLNQEAIEKADWTQAPVITQDTVKASRPLTPTLVSQGKGSDTNVTLRVKSTPGRYLLVHLPAGFGPSADRTLEKGFTRIFAVPQASSRLSFVEPGTMMTLSGAKTLTMHAAGLKNLTYRLYRVRDPYLALSAEQTDPFNIDNLATMVSGNLPHPDVTGVDGHYFSLKLDQLIQGGLKPGLYDLVIEADKTLADDQGDRLQVAKRLLVSDVGLIAKRSQNGTPTVYALDLTTGKPASGITVDLVAANGLTIESQTTNDTGEVRFGDVTGLERERLPVALIARRTIQSGSVVATSADSTPAPTGTTKTTGFEATNVVAWLSLTNWENRDQFWQFKVDGRQVKDTDLVGALTTDRTLYRPGETVHLGAVIKSANWTPVLEDTPLKVEVVDPLGGFKTLNVMKTRASGLSESDWTLPADATPGIWIVRLLAGDTVLDNQSIRIQRFEPESMVLSVDAPKTVHRGWVMPQDATLTATLAYGFGDKAPERSVRGQLLLEPPADIKFEGFEDYVFTSPDSDGLTPITRTLTPAKTNANGEAALALGLESSLSGVLRAQVNLEGTDDVGARVATNEADFLVSNLPYWVGYRVSNTATPLWDIHAGEAIQLDLAMVNPSLVGETNQALTAEVSAQRYITELVADDRGYLSYRETPQYDVLKTEALQTDNAGHATLTLLTDAPGDYAVRILDREGRLLTKLSYQVLGNTIKPEMALPTAHMKLTVPEKAYQPGDTVEASVLSPFDGTALLTLEANGVLTHQWADVKVGYNQVALKLPDTADGKYWLTVSLVRSHTWANRFLKAYSSATAPLMVNREAHDLALRLTAPEVQADPKSVRFTLAAAQDGEAMLWAVDEAVLAPTRYQLLKPYEALFANRGLSTDTFETLEDLMPEGLNLPGLTPTGGGDALEKAALSASLSNPFRRQMGDVAMKWLGIVPVGTTPKEYVMALPENFQGKVRVMAVGANATQVGSVSATTTLRQALAATPNFPTYLAPGDVALGVVNITADPEALEKAKAEATPPSASVRFTLEGPIGLDGKVAGKDPVQLPLSSDTALTFTLRATQRPGSAKIRTELTGLGQTVVRDRTLSVRPATLARTESDWGRMQAPTLTLKALPELLPFEAKTELFVGPSPLPVAASLVSQLRDDPLDLEAKIDTAMAWTYLARKPQLLTALGLSATDVSEELKKRVPVTVSLIKARLPWGGFMEPLRADMAPHPDWALTAKALDFALLVRTQGIPSEADTVAQQLVKEARQSLYNTPILTLRDAQAYSYLLYTLTRAGVLTTEPLEWLRQQIETNQIDVRTDITRRWMGLSYALMGVTEEVKPLLTGPVTLGKTTRDELPEYLAALRYARDSNLVSDTLSSLTDAPAQLPRALASQALMGLVAGLETPADGASASPVQLTCQKWSNEFSAHEITLTPTLNGAKADITGCITLTMSGKKEGLYYAWSASGYRATLPSVPQEAGIRVRKTILKNDLPLKGGLALGDQITVEIRVTRYQGDDQDTIVLTDLLPAGFTLVTNSSEDLPAQVEQINDEDRVVFLVEPTENETVLRYNLRATTPGTFTLPPSEAHLSRSPSVNGMTAAGHLTVKRQP